MKSCVRLGFFLALLGAVSCSDPPPGKMIAFDGYKLHIIESGTGEPAVIFEGGLNCATDLYDNLRIGVAEFTRAISYDHAGIGYSTRNKNPRTLPNFVNELVLLLEKEKISPPYILVGHSMGGFTIRYFAHKYPKDIVGLVFIDQPPDEWFNYIRTTHSPEDIKKFNGIFDPELTDFYIGIGKEELRMYEYNAGLMKEIKIPAHIPVRMLTSVKYEELQQLRGYHPEDMAVWAKMQAEVLQGLPDAKQIITEKSGHFLQSTEPELVIDAIRELVDIYRVKK